MKVKFTIFQNDNSFFFTKHTLIIIQTTLDDSTTQILKQNEWMSCILKRLTKI